MNGLLDWLESPAQGQGLQFLQDSETWEFYSFEALANRSYGIAWRIKHSGIERGAVICVLLPTGPEFFTSMFGTWIAGGTVCPIVPPMIFEDETAYLNHVVRIVQAAQPTILVTNSSYLPIVKRVVATAGISGARTLDVAEVAESLTTPETPAEVALLQFTSGSSGIPRGVKVSFENLVSNIYSIRRWIHMEPDEVTATWLPLYHDMGLIGCLLTPTVNQSDVWIMRPDQFIREPLTWLECFGKRGASLCAAPNFGYGYAARRINPDSLEGMDFSSWRLALVGAEPVDAHALTQLSELLAPFGFSNDAFLPAYGLAEATLAVTGGSTEGAAPAVDLDWDSLSFGESVPVKGTARLGDLDGSASSGWLVGSGRPHPGMEIRILGDNSEDLPGGTLGEILVRGPSVALGYADERQDSATTFCNGGVLTGDAGFVIDDELYVVGRITDSIKVRGRSIYSDDLEARISTTTGLRRGRFVVIAIPGESGGAILTIAEDASHDWAIATSKLLKGITGAGTPVRVAIGPRGTIQRTSSGKPRRRVMWKLERSGQLQFDHVIDI